jgi:hypothetical protein
MMSEDLTRRDSEDDQAISLRADHEARHWSNRFGVSVERLKEVVQKVGPSPAAVKRELATCVSYRIPIEPPVPRAPDFMPPAAGWVRSGKARKPRKRALRKRTSRKTV